jgi:hypothetical protein
MADQPVIVHYQPSLAAELHREKLLLRRRAELPKNLIPLPGFRFTAPLRQSTADVHELFVKGMFEFLAAAVAEVGPRRQWVFVSLVQLKLNHNEIGFVFHCPFRRLVEAAQKQMEQARQRRSLDVPVKMTRRLALPADTLMPVVFVYEPEQERLTLTNENHIGAPSQFLKPELADTTSGLLNFVGAFSCATEFDDAEKHITELLNSSETAIRGDLDEWLRWFHSLVETRRLIDTDAVLVDPDRPERYYYNYSR